MEKASFKSTGKVSGKSSPQTPDSSVGPAAPLPARADLLEAARSASGSPGVYLMKDAQNLILYVGKAKNLKNRLSSYFLAPPHEVARTEMLVNRVHHFDVILTETESEALILECTLIKKHRPKFNVRLKDDKAYPYLKIQITERFPRIEWTRRVQRDGARYFGPFPSAWSARQVMGLLNESFELRDCSDNTFRHRTRPCILYQMGKCSGPCVAKIVENQYRDSIHQAIAVLEGKTDRLIQELRKGMEDAAEHEDFESAAEYRDQIRNLELVTATQGVVEAGSVRDRDVVGLARGTTEGGHAVVLQIRSGKLIAVRHYHLQNLDPSVPDSELLAEFLGQYYVATGAAQKTRDPEQASEAERQAHEVLLPSAPEDAGELEQLIGIGLRTADSTVDEQLLSVARSNAQYALDQASKKEGGHGIQALEEVQDKLQLPKLPHRIECYDISNILGQDAVASRVVFMDGAPDKNLYRRYKMRTGQATDGSAGPAKDSSGKDFAGNDFAMMREVLSRRFAAKESGEIEELPDLVVVDGGKGQLSQAVAILEELGLQGVGVVGLAKARVERDFKATEVKSSMERIFIPNRKNPVPLLPHTAAYKLLTHVRDEAHRFAINYHRLLRGKRSLKSEG